MLSFPVAGNVTRCWVDITRQRVTLLATGKFSTPVGHKKNRRTLLILYGYGCNYMYLRHCLELFVWRQQQLRVICTLSILVNISLFTIFTNQHLQNLDSNQNQTASGVTPDPFFRHHKEKQKKAVWPRETIASQLYFSGNYQQCYTVLVYQKPCGWGWWGTTKWLEKLCQHWTQAAVIIWCYSQLHISHKAAKSKAYLTS